MRLSTAGGSGKIWSSSSTDVVLDHNQDHHDRITLSSCRTPIPDEDVGKRRRAWARRNILKLRSFPKLMRAPLKLVRGATARNVGRRPNSCSASRYRTRETLAQQYACWRRRIPLRDGAQCDRACVATGGLHTFVRTQQRRRACAQ